MDNEIFREWVMNPDTTPEQISRARSIVDFLDWSSCRDGRGGDYVNEGGYDLRRSVSVCGSHDYEVVEDTELAELVILFLKEEQ
jgi:hypothetical protein